MKGENAADPRARGIGIVGRLVRRCILVALLGGACAVLPSCETLPRGVGDFTTVVIDAGHGGTDPGARALDGSREKTYALDVAKRVAAQLRRRGYRVVMTRTGDYFVPLPTRAAISNRQRNAIFVSIHFNMSPRRAAYGLETYYHTPYSRPLAASIQREIMRVYRTPDRGVKFANFHVLRNNARPAVLVELGFVSNPYEFDLIRRPAHRQQLADAVVRGIINARR